MSVGLVLEGGGTRGAYTSGVLDVFNENQIVFPVVYGISAGACNALSYISGQVGRNFRIFYDYIQDDRYMSVSSLRKTGNLFGFDFIFGELSHKPLPSIIRFFCIPDPVDGWHHGFAYWRSHFLKRGPDEGLRRCALPARCRLYRKQPLSRP
ncbi:MAG: patatin-like phospholipase family protein [Anaeromassilibacillus sp.]